MTTIKTHFSAISTAIKAYKSVLAERAAAEAKRQKNERFMQAAKYDPLSILFQAKFG
jgi:hypothetical protein